LYQVLRHLDGSLVEAMLGAWVERVLTALRRFAAQLWSAAALIGIRAEN
jgi:hypothetical protein